MLVLTRATGETIVIGDDIQITFLGMSEKKATEAKIGISAPRHVSVHRLEIYERIQKEKANGSGLDDPSTKG